MATRLVGIALACRVDLYLIKAAAQAPPRPDADAPGMRPWRPTRRAAPGRQWTERANHPHLGHLGIHATAGYRAHPLSSAYARWRRGFLSFFVAAAVFGEGAQARQQSSHTAQQCGDHADQSDCHGHGPGG